MHDKIFFRDSNSRSSVMVWRVISRNRCTPFVKVPKICESKKSSAIFQEGLIPYYDDGDIFQPDGVPCHISEETKKFLEDHGLKTVEWSEKSPDLNPIENTWSWMVEKIYFGKPAYWNVQAVVNTWERMPDSLIEKLIDSMPIRMEKSLRWKERQFIINHANKLVFETVDKLVCFLKFSIGQKMSFFRFLKASREILQPSLLILIHYKWWNIYI